MALPYASAAFRDRSCFPRWWFDSETDEAHPACTLDSTEFTFT